MLKRRTIFIILIVFSALLLVVSAQQPSSTIGSNWETSCTETECQTALYSYEKYWHNEQGEWEAIDENWFDCSGNLGQVTFCTKNYYFNVTADENGLVSTHLLNGNYSLRLGSLIGSNFVFRPVINGSLITYENVIPNVDLRYQYLPHKMKEEIIIKERLANLPAQSFNISFIREGSASVHVERAYICDANMACQYLNSRIAENSIDLEIPLDFLNNPNTLYPVVIDPTVTLNETYIAWNGHISYQSSPNNYTRYHNPSTISLSNSSTTKYRGDIDWNISSILDGSIIKNLTVSLYTSAPSFPHNLSIMQMEGGNSSYSDIAGDCPNGNCLFYNDIGNGTEYNRTRINVKNVYQNYTLSSQSLTDFQNKLSGDIFGLGLTTDYVGTVTIGSRDYAVAAQRPKLIIIYGVNGTDADAAIEQGINSSLPNNPISSGQQIYLVNENGTHFLGRFDKSTILNNQTWSFNYVEAGQSFINMPSLFRVLNVWENETLSFNEIVNQVSAFINATRY